MIIPLLARSVNRSRAGDVQLYTASAEQTVNFAHSPIANGPLLFARRDTDAMAGMTFGGAFHRIGGTDGNWGGSGVVSKSVSGLTRNSGNSVTLSTAFDWNDATHDGDRHIVWSFSTFDSLSWTGTGGSPSAQAHGLGVVPGAIFVTEDNGGGVTDFYIWHSADPNVVWSTVYGRSDQGTPQFNVDASNVTPIASELFDTSSYDYVARVIPGNEITPGTERTIRCGQAQNAVAETLGWAPRSIIYIDTAGNVRTWVQARGTVGDNSADLSTQLSGTSGVNTNGAITVTATGFTGPTCNYIAFR